MYRIETINKETENKNKLVVTRGWGREKTGVNVNVVSAKVLKCSEISGDGCTILLMG